MKFIGHTTTKKYPELLVENPFVPVKKQIYYSILYKIIIYSIYIIKNKFIKKKNT
jgi:hypothetical protein